MTTTNEYVVTNESEEILATYNLVLIGPGPPGTPVGYERNERGEFEEYEGIRPSLLREIEEDVTDLLPADYRVVIREWNETEETP